MWVMVINAETGDTAEANLAVDGSDNISLQIAYGGGGNNGAEF